MDRKIAVQVSMQDTVQETQAPTILCQVWLMWLLGDFQTDQIYVRSTTTGRINSSSRSIPSTGNPAANGGSKSAPALAIPTAPTIPTAPAIPTARPATANEQVGIPF